MKSWYKEVPSVFLILFVLTDAIFLIGHKNCWATPNIFSNGVSASLYHEEKLVPSQNPARKNFSNSPFFGTVNLWPTETYDGIFSIKLEYFQKLDNFGKNAKA